MLAQPPNSEEVPRVGSAAGGRAPSVSGRILIVDDDERQRTALAAMLSDVRL